MFSSIWLNSSSTEILNLFHNKPKQGRNERKYSLESLIVVTGLVLDKLSIGTLIWFLTIYIYTKPCAKQPVIPVTSCSISLYSCGTGRFTWKPSSNTCQTFVIQIKHVTDVQMPVNQNKTRSRAPTLLWALKTWNNVQPNYLLNPAVCLTSDISVQVLSVWPKGGIVAELGQWLPFDCIASRKYRMNSMSKLEK